MTEPRELLHRGRAVLDPVLCSRGFTFRLIKEGSGSGGHFAVGRYEKPGRSIELHVRFELGIVIYRLNGSELRHQQLMDCLGVMREDQAYPGFSEDPVEGFEHLRQDLEGPLRAFVDGEEDARFLECAEEPVVTPDPERHLP